MTQTSNTFNRHRAIALLAAAALLVMPLFTAAGASDTQPPTEKTISPGAETTDGMVTASGILKKQGITSYMYGTHVLVNETGRTLYSLKSGRVDLEAYIGKKVTVRGKLINGYPVDNGPNYLEVSSIRDAESR